MKVCELAWPVLLTHLSGAVTVSEEEIVSAMRLVGRLYGNIIMGSPKTTLLLPSLRLLTLYVCDALSSIVIR